MNKNILLLLTILIIFSCGTQKSYPDYVLGINENSEKKSFDKDSLHILTPAIEIYKRVRDISYSQYGDREDVKKFVIETLKSELIKSEYYELKLMSEDYSSVNEVLEVITYHKYKNPEWIVRAPEEILIKDRKSTRLNYSHVAISYAVFCLQKKNEKEFNFFRINHLSVVDSNVYSEDKIVNKPGVGDGSRLGEGEGHRNCMHESRKLAEHTR